MRQIMSSKISLQSVLIFFALVLVDQALKFIVVRFYPQIVTFNSGILFGFVDNIFVILSLLVLGLVILGYLIWEAKHLEISLILILSGAISNIADRLMHEGVVDYITIKNWSNFNLADVYIVLGVLFYLYKLVFVAKNK